MNKGYMRRWLVFCLTLSAGLAPAATNSWTNTAGGAFSNGGNWEGGVVPGAVDVALFTNPATYTVTFDQPVTNSEGRFNASGDEVGFSLGGWPWYLTNALHVGQVSGSSASVGMTGGWLQVRTLNVGVSNSASGRLSLAGVTGTVTASAGLSVGGRGTGLLALATADTSLMITGGGTHVVGDVAGASGTILLPLGSLAVTGSLQIGNSGTGLLALGNATGNVSATFTIGSSSGGVGTVTLDHPGAFFGGQLFMANATGTVASLYVSNGVFESRGETKLGLHGQSLVYLAGGDFRVVPGSGTTHTYLPQGSGTSVLVLDSAESDFYLDGTLWLGRNNERSRGEVYLTNGSANAAAITLGYTSNSFGWMEIYNATATVRQASDVAFWVAQGIQSTGQLLMADARALLFAQSNALVVGGAGTGTFLFSNGTVQVKGLTVGRSDGSRGLMVMQAGTLTVFTNDALVGNATGSWGRLVVSNGTVNMRRLIVGNNGYGELSLHQQATATLSENLLMPNDSTGNGVGTGLLVLASGSPVLNISNGTAKIGATWAGAKGGCGHLLVSNGTVNVRYIEVGEASEGRLTVLDGAVLQTSTNAGDGLKVGMSAEGGTGIVVLAHANALIHMPSNTLNLGYQSYSVGQIMISTGTVVVRDVSMGGALARNTGSVGRLVIGEGSLTLRVGSVDAGAGTEGRAYLLLNDPKAQLVATNIASNAGIINLGMGTNSVGSLVMSNGTLYARAVKTGGSIGPTGQYGEWIIHNATGMLREIGAASSTAIWLAGRYTCTGLMVLAHAGAYVETTNTTLVGDGGVGTLIVSNGTFKSANLTIGSQTGSVGRLRIEGGRVEIGSELKVIGAASSTNATATLELSGGTLALTRLTPNSAVGATSNLWLSGGTLLALTSLTTTIDATLTNSPGPGLVTFDSSTNSILYSGRLSGPGSLAKTGAGQVALSVSNDFTGETRVQEGTLLLQSAGSIANSTSIIVAAGALLNVTGRTDRTLTLGAAQVLKGNGTVRGAVTNGGVVAPGASAGTLNLSAHYTQSGELAVEIGGTTPGTGHDVLAVTSNAVLAGTLRVSLIDGFNPAAGQSFTVLTAGAVSGTFDTTNLPALAGGLDWQVSYAGNVVSLGVLATGGPVVGPVTFSRVAGLPLKIPASLLATNAYDAGGGPVTCSWVSATSSNGHPVSLQAGWVYYTPPSDSNTTDYFSFKLANTNGQENGSVATIEVYAPTAAVAVIASPVSTNGNLFFRWSGIVGRTNDIEGATALGPTPPANWSNIGSAVIGSLGYAEFVETNPPSPRYYRILEHLP